MSRIIASKRLMLREIEESDCSDAYIAWLADPEVNRYLETRYKVQDKINIVSFVKAVRAREDEFLLAILLKESGRHIGNIKVGPISAVHRLADVSLFIGARDCWGRGYAAEAIAAVSQYAFDALGVLKLSASMYAPNLGSKHAFLKVGYREEGLRRAHYVLDGERCDLVELGLVPSDLAQ
jgi:RimJ/RimL family protein N-acetyltransferase